MYPFVDLIKSDAIVGMLTKVSCGMNNLIRIIQFSTFQFLLKHKRTRLGSLWIIITPAVFIFFIGFLYSGIAGLNLNVFIPHMTIGYVGWTLLGGFVQSSSTVVVRHQGFVSQAGASMENIATMEMTSIFLQFFHQAILVFIILMHFKVEQDWYSFVSILGVFLAAINGRSAIIVLGTICVRYRDMQEAVGSIVRIAFLATPIIWMAGEDGRGGLIGPYTLLNPFYHFLEIIRAPLLGNRVADISWYIVLTITGVGLLLSFYFSRRFRRQIPLWL